MRLINADAIKFDYSGLSQIFPDDFWKIAKYFADQVECAPTILTVSAEQEYGIPDARLRELAEADKDGRCVVLPCAPDEVYWEMIGNTPAVSRFDGICTIDTDMNLFYKIEGDDVSAKEIGKTVFLTREAAESAEAALEAADGQKV